MPRLGLGLGLAKGSVLYSFFGTIISNFISRVTADGGTFEAQTCLQNYLNSLGQSLYNKASLIITPNAYKAGKIYALKPTNGSGDLTFSRGSARTRRNASGVIESLANNVPALNYPVSGCPTWLFESQRTNICLHSEDFTNASWSKVNSAVSANAALSPDGTLTADLLYPTSSGIIRGVEQPITVVPSNIYSNTLYLRHSNWTWVYVGGINGSNGAWFNIASGTVGTVQVGVTASIENIGNEWYRIRVTNTASGTTGFNWLRLTDSDNSLFCTANGTSGVFVWGAQTELGVFPTSYIPTSSATATRLNDIASISRNVPTEATIYADTYLQAGSLSDGNIYSIFDLRVTGTQRISLYRFNNQIHADIVNSTIQFAGSIYNIPTLVQGQRYRIAVRLTATQMVVFINGSIVYTSGTLSMPNLSSGNTIYHGNLAGNTAVWGGLLGPFYIADSALSNDECISLTTN